MEQPLVRPISLFLFAGFAVVGLHYSTPSSLELAKLRMKSFDVEGAEPLLRELAQDEPDDPAILRHLADALEARGKVDEAAAILKELIRLRPLNRSYWERLGRLYEWNGDTMAAVRTRESMLQRGLIAVNRKNVMALAREFEWLEAPDDVLRLYHVMWSAKLYESEDVEPMMSFYLHNGRPEFALKFGVEAVERGIASKRVQGGMMYVFSDLGNHAAALRFLALLFGATPAQAAEALRVTDFLSKIPSKRVREDAVLFEAFIWLYVNAGNKEAALVAADHMERNGHLRKSAHFYFADIQLDLKRTGPAEATLRRIASRSDLSVNDWRELASRFANLGKQRIAARILEDLLEGRVPSLSGESSYWVPLKPLLLASNSMQFLSPLVSAIDDSPVLLAANSMADKERIATYRQLLEVYDSRSETGKSIALIEKVLAEIAEGRLEATSSQEQEFREALAERHTWQSSPFKALEALSPLPFASLSPKARAIFCLSLDENGDTNRAGQHAAEIGGPERASLSAELRDRLADIDRRYALSLAEAERAAREPAEIIPHVRRYDSVAFSPNHVTGVASVISGGEMTAFGPEVHGSYGSQRWMALARASATRLSATGEQIVSGKVGVEHRHEDRRFQLLGGAVSRGYFPVQLEGIVSGSLPMISFFHVGVELARPLVETKGLAENRVSETRLTLYVEHRPAPWMEITATAQGRLTHQGETVLQGQGGELASRIGMGIPEWPLRVGPWLSFTRWGSDNDRLRNLLLPRNSIVGGFAGLQLGNKQSGWQGRLTAGLGMDLSLDDKKLESVFVEAGVDNLFSDDVGLKVDYGLYTSKFGGILSEAFHVASLSVVKGW